MTDAKAAAASQAAPRWRVGNKKPINVYEGDRAVCNCRTPKDAAQIVAALNAAETRSQAAAPPVEAVGQQGADAITRLIEKWRKQIDQRMYSQPSTMVLLDCVKDLEVLKLSDVPAELRHNLEACFEQNQRLAAENRRLREALERIARHYDDTGDDCACDHTDENCCVLVGIFCPHCISQTTLAASETRTGGKQP